MCEFSLRTDVIEDLRVERSTAATKKRKIELFMRALLVAGDVETLRLAGNCQWHDGMKRYSFPVDVHMAIRTSHTETVEWAFQQLADVANADDANKSALSFPLAKWKRCWGEAMDHFPGHCGVLEVLYAYILKPGEPEPVYPFRDDFDPDFKFDLELWIEIDKNQSLEMVQWIITHIDIATVSSSALEHAAAQKDWLLIQYLATVPGMHQPMAIKLATTYASEIRAFMETIVVETRESKTQREGDDQ